FSSAQANDVQFFVFDAQDNLANLAQLDSLGSNESIPNNCLNCHGGTYDPQTGALVGATFLPFDPSSFLFSTQPDFTYAVQEDQFRQLNLLVRSSGPPPSIVQFVNGLYDDHAETPGTHANLDWIPPGWNTDDVSKVVYREVVRPYCRTCHMSQIGDFSFLRLDDFKKQATLTAD